MFFPQRIHSETGRAWIVGGAVFLGLNLLLRLPDLLVRRFPLDLGFYLSDPSRLYYFFSLDLFCLLSLLLLVPVDRAERWIYYVLTGSILFLLGYRIYDAVVVSMLHRSPVFYADYSHVIGALYLLLNASIPWLHIAGVLGAGGIFVLGVWHLPTVLQTVHRTLDRSEVRWGVLAAHLILWPLVGVAAVTDQGIERETYQEVCLATVECVVYNVQASAVLHRQVLRRQHRAVDSTYARYRAVDWSHPPSLYVVMVESYGAVLGEKKGPLHSAYHRLAGRMADSLGASGWRAATAKSEAPVFGGLSWLSLATLLAGTPVAHQPTYEMLRPKLSRYPHLVWFLQRQGYRTGTLQPPVRARPGLRVANPYGFGRTLYFEDLDYQGPSYGWGIVPDQYSLSVAHEQFVEQTDRPFFLFFETVTSHGRWNRAPPPLVEEPTVWNRSADEGHARSLSTTARGAGREAARPDTLSRPERYFRHVRYEWRVLRDYLRTEAPRNSLVVVLGDHQPFFAEGASLATPLHVLSRDQELVRRFEEYGFVPGLQLSPAADTLHHAGMYSLLVRVLTAHDRATKNTSFGPLPPYRSHGVERPALVGSQS